MESIIEIANINNSIVVRDNDFYAIQNQNKAVVYALKTLGVPFVVNGCVVSGTAPNNAVSAGIVFLDGEFHTLPAIGSIDLGSTKYIKFLSSTDSDPRALSGGGTQNRIRTKLAQITAGVTTQSIAISQAVPAVTFADIVGGSIEAPITLTPTAVEFSAVSPMQYRKSKQGLVKLSGAAQKMQNNGANIVATLPVGYRPSQIKNFAITEDAYIFASATVYTNGEIWVNPTAALNKIYWLDGISFYTDM